VQRDSHDHRRECQSEQSTRDAEQQTLEDRFPNDRHASGAQGQPDSIFVAPPNGSHQQKAGNIHAGNEQHDANSNEQSAQQRLHISDDVIAQQRHVASDMNRGHIGREIPHDLLGDAVRILRRLREGHAILHACDHVVAPEAGVRVGEFVSAQAHGDPELCLVKAPGLQGKFKIARHYADDRVSLAIEIDRPAKNQRVAVKAVEPQRVADHDERLAGILFLPRKHAAKDGMNAESRKDARG